MSQQLQSSLLSRYHTWIRKGSPIQNKPDQQIHLNDVLPVEWNMQKFHGGGVVLVMYVHGMKKYAYQQNLQNLDWTSEIHLSPDTYMSLQNK